MADPLATFTFPAAKGINLRVDPEDLPPGFLADCVNVDINRPYGVAQPREGSRTLTDQAASPNGGHPINPLGNSDFLMTANVLRYVKDEVNRRLFAIVKSAPGLAKIYVADLTTTAPGFGAGTAPFSIDSERVPGVILHDGFLIVATGIAGEYKNVIYDRSLSVTYTHKTYTTPLRPPDPTAVDGGAGALDVGKNVSYRCGYYSSKTRARSPFSGDVEIGPLNRRKVTVTVRGSTPAPGLDIFDKIEIYRTTDGGSIWRYLATVDNPGSSLTTTYTDQTPDDQLSLRTLPIRYGRPPTTRYGLLHNDRALYAYRSQTPIDGSVVYYSEPYAPLNVDPVFNVVTVRPDDGAQIVGLFALYNRVYVLKSNGAVFELASNLPQSVYRVDPIIDAGPHACVSHATIVSMSGRAMWLTRIGVVAFNGESIQPASFGVEPAFVDTQLTDRALSGELPSETGDGGYVSLDFRNTDVVTEEFFFKLRFFTAEPTDPAVDPPHEEIDSLANPEYFEVMNAPVPATGVRLGPGQEVSLRCYPQTLVSGQTYYVYKQVRDTGGTVDWFIGGTTGDWIALPETYLYQPILPGGLDLAWGTADKFHAIDFWPRHELWVFVASKHSDDIDTRWILDYQTLGGDEPPLWRRDTVHATAAILIDGLDLSAEQENLAVAVLGDANGCCWADHWPGRIDRVVEGVSLRLAHRNGKPPAGPQRPPFTGPFLTAETDANGDYWTLSRGLPYDPATQAWPVTAPKLRGQVVTVRTGRGDTFTGLIVDNTETTLTIRFWLEGRIPPTAQSLSMSIGGIDAHLDYYPTPLDGPQMMKEVRQMILRGIGLDVPVDVELRWGDQSEPVTWGSVQRQDYEQLVAEVGGNRFRYPFLARTRFVGGRIGTHACGMPWQLASWGFMLGASDARQ